MNPILILVSVALLVLPITDWVAVLVFRRAVRLGGGPALRERAHVAAILAVATTLNAAVSALGLAAVVAGAPVVDPAVVTALLAVSLVLPGLPNVLWLWMYYRSSR